MTTTPEELLSQAREALESTADALATRLGTNDHDRPTVNRAHAVVAAIDAHLKQPSAPSGEPVAQLVAQELERLAQDPPISGNALAQTRVLMTAASVRQFGLAGGATPQAAVQPLTDEQIADIWFMNGMNPTVYARAIQRACAAAWGVTLAATTAKGQQ